MNWTINCNATVWGDFILVFMFYCDSGLFLSVLCSLWGVCRSMLYFCGVKINLFWALNLVITSKTDLTWAETALIGLFSVSFLHHEQQTSQSTKSPQPALLLMLLFILSWTVTVLFVNFKWFLQCFLNPSVIGIVWCFVWEKVDAVLQKPHLQLCLDLFIE